MKWATRPHCHVDRAASAWLIRRFIDPEASFVFVEDPEDIPSDAIGFDLRGVELTHHNHNCTFETMLEYYGLTDAGLESIGRIVHEADLGDERFDAPEAPGLDVLIRGLGFVYEDDNQLISATEPLFDGLYEHCRRAAETAG
jgi:hypothetical protein